MDIDERDLQRFLGAVMRDYKDGRVSLDESIGAVALLVEAVQERDPAAVSKWLDCTRDPAGFHH